MDNIKKFVVLGMLMFVMVFQIEANAATVQVGSYRFTLSGGADMEGITSEVKKISAAKCATVHIGTYKAGGNYPTRAYVVGNTFTPEKKVTKIGTYYLYYIAKPDTGVGYELRFVSNKNNLRNTTIAGSWTP